MKDTRRRLLAAAACLLVAPLALSCAKAPPETQVIVLGFDGMDYAYTQKLMQEGRMPNFSKLAADGTFGPLATAVPPQSPVAWSNFITGMDSGGHGIFDFVHRDPDSMQPYLSTSKTEGTEKALKLGKYKFPLAGGEVKLLRHGTPFWELLEEHGVESHIYRMPANFPPSGSASRELSGMGTPDILGTPGTFSFYTSDIFVNERQISGGAIYALDYWDNRAEGRLHGPENPFLQRRRTLSADFAVYVDPEAPVAKLVVGEEERVLSVGEWSDWVPVEFEMIPTQVLPAMGRFYLRSVRPEVELYVSPLQIDPMAPAMPISMPESFAAELARRTGRFYTQGMPEDTKALTGDVFSREEFLAQAKITGDEILEQYEYVLDTFDAGLLFYYFGNLDLICHTMFRSTDPTHPAYDPERDPEYLKVVEATYEAFDRIVGYTLEHKPDDAKLIVMSDHGFSSWRRAFHLNDWLIENGYMVVKNPDKIAGTTIYSNVDWTKTRAYGLGLNGLFVNVQGRESKGVVPESERDALLAEISEKLLAVIDPVTGEPAVTRMYTLEDTYEGEHLGLGPDLQVGYNKGTRCSFESAIGDLTGEAITDNMSEWSGDHCMDHTKVPGILLTSEELAQPARSLKQLGGAVLAEFGISWTGAAAEISTGG
ncbi:MAG: alkaline phosphatase family protein [Thermoanaerobaculia bacterium]